MARLEVLGALDPGLSCAVNVVLDQTLAGRLQGLVRIVRVEVVDLGMASKWFGIGTPLHGRSQVFF